LGCSFFWCLFWRLCLGVTSVSAFLAPFCNGNTHILSPFIF
jgi:hypothetical protein